MYYAIEVYYFDRKGQQKIKLLEAKTEKGILSKYYNFKDNNDFYRMGRVSPNLVDFEG